MKKKCATGAKVTNPGRTWVGEQTKVLSQARTMCKGGKVSKKK